MLASTPPMARVTAIRSAARNIPAWATRSSFARLREAGVRLPLWYACSSAPFALVGLCLVAVGRARYPVEAALWMITALTSHMCDVHHFGRDSAWLPVDVVFASLSISAALCNAPPLASATVLPTCLFFFVRGQCRDARDARKIRDHALWHWCGQSLRIATPLITNL